MEQSMRCPAWWSDHIVIAQCTRVEGHRGRHKGYDRWAHLTRRWNYGDPNDAGDNAFGATAQIG